VYFTPHREMPDCRPVVRNLIDNEEPYEPVRTFPPPPNAKKRTLDSLSATENKNPTYYAIIKSKGMNILLVRTSRLRQRSLHANDIA